MYNNKYSYIKKLAGELYHLLSAETDHVVGVGVEQDETNPANLTICIDIDDNGVKWMIPEVFHGVKVGVHLISDATFAARPLASGKSKVFPPMPESAPNLL